MGTRAGPKLGLEAIGRVPEGSPHYTGIGDHDVEGPPVGDQRVGAGPHAFKRGVTDPLA